MSAEALFPSIPAHWKLTTLGELAKASGGGIQTGPFGSQLHASDYVNNGIPSIMPKNISVDSILTDDIARVSSEDITRLSKYKVHTGDIIYSRRGDVEKCARITQEENGWLCGTGCLRVRVFPGEVSTEYLHAYLCHPNVREWIVRHAVGATMPNLNTSILSALPVIVPSKSEMEQIGSSWLSISEKILINHQINQTLEQIAQALFKSWFVDFEPVKAKIVALEAGGSEEDALLAAMQAISGTSLFDAGASAAGAAEQLARLQAEQPEQYAELRATAELFPSAMQDSELGEIPEGWVVTQIGDEVTVVGGGTPSTKNPTFWEDGQINWTSPKDLSNLPDKVLVETVRKITEAGLSKISSGLLPVDTVLMSSRAPVGYIALAKIPIAVNQGYIAMKCEKVLRPEFVIQWCEAHMDEIKSRASGTTFAEISKKSFKIIPLVMPPRPLVSIYSRQTSSLYEAIENNIRESDTLETIRDSLLPKLLSGELSLPSVKEQPELQVVASV